MIGAMLSHYRIVKKLGEGGMGQVYLAHDTRLERPAALKIIRQESASDPDRHARFLQEAKAVSALDHPNIAHLYEIGEVEGVRFIAMQYVEGKTLAAIIQEGRIPARELLDIAIQVAGALEEAHSKGIVHRDVKPANIMLTSRGQIKVLDFGIAKVLPGSKVASPSERAPVTVEGVAMGTVFYLSPEQALERSVDHRSDIFSFGISLYEMAAGKLPFNGATTMEILNAIINAPPDPLPVDGFSLPEEMKRILSKCLEKDPDKRYQSAQDLQLELTHLREDLIYGSEQTKRTRTSKAAPRNFAMATIALLLLLAVAVAAWFGLRRPREQTIHSLAVLPFSNESSEAGTEYLSDGITDSTINSLSQLPGIKVLARGTVFTYKGKEMDPRQIGKELQVDAVVTGAIFQQGSSLSIQVSLVNTADGAQVWGRRYNSKFEDILTVQTEISNQISSELRLTLSGKQQEQLAKQYTANPEAYRLYLMGRYYWNRRTEPDFRKAIESFEQAIAIDPQYALPYAGLADCFALLSNWGFIPAEDGFTRARAAARKALEFDPTLAEAHTSLASISSGYEWEWKKAEQEFQRAIELNPNYSTAHHWYSFYLSQIGRHEEAIEEIEIAKQLDPLSLIINANRGYTLYVARRYDAALEQLEQTLALDPRFALAYEYLGYTYEQKKDYKRAVESHEKSIELSPENLTFSADLARACALSGNIARAEKLLKGLLEQSKQKYVAPYDIANIYIGLGRNDLAFEWLEKAYLEHSDQITYIRMEPRMDALRADPRFADLLKRIHL